MLIPFGLQPALSAAASLALAATPAFMETSNEISDPSSKTERHSSVSTHSVSTRSISTRSGDRSPARSLERGSTARLSRVLDALTATGLESFHGVISPQVSAAGLGSTPSMFAGQGALLPGVTVGSGTSGLADSDGDTLPDRLEQVLTLDPANADSNGDGWDDREAFLAVTSAPSATPHHQIRLAVHSEASASGPVLWINCFFHVVGQQLAPTVSSLDLFLLTDDGVRLSLLSALATSPLHVASEFDPDRGRFVRISFPFALESDLDFLLPAVIGLEVTMAGETKTSGVFVESTPSGLSTTVPLEANAVTQQPTDPDRKGDGFWDESRLCFLRLGVLGTAPDATLLEVVSADCVVTESTAVCPSTCAGSVGRLILVPDMIATITGG